MNTRNPLIFTLPTDVLWESSPEQHDRLWAAGQTIQSRAGQWRAYLNRMAEQAVLHWGKTLLETDAIAPCPDFVDQSHAAWVSGTALTWGDKRLVIIPSDHYDSDELRVPQEWIEIESWVADYYIAAQVNPEAGQVRLWSYTTHQILKTSGLYCNRDRTYALDAEALDWDLSSLAIALPLFAPSQTRASVPPLPTLSMSRAEELLDQCGDPNALCSRLMVPFTEWGALLAHDNLRDLLVQRHQTSVASVQPSLRVQLQTWFDQQFPADWCSPQAVLLPVRSQRSFPPLSRAKLIDLGLLLESQPLALLVWLQEPSVTIQGTQYEIKLEVRPTGSQVHLPSGLVLKLLDDQQIGLTEVTARDRDNWIELSFTVDAGTQFEVQLQLLNECFSETFLI